MEDPSRRQRPGPPGQALTEPRPLEALAAGVEAWTRWRDRHPGVRPSLQGANLRGWELGGADLSDALLNDADLSGASLRGANLSQTILRGADLTRVQAAEADFTNARMHHATLIEADLRGANLTGAELPHANLTRANAVNARMDETNCRKAVLKQANLSNVTFRNADLREVSFADAQLRRAKLIDADLFNTNLSADLRSADLRGATLQRAFAAKANLVSANLSGADLSEAQLQQANLTAAKLRGANLHGARLLNTVLARVDLGETHGLEHCRHQGPSILDHTTLSASGVLPMVFLRGVGLPDVWIEYLPTLVGNAIDFYSCFISYSHHDRRFARRLFDQLQGQGIRCWLDEHQMLPGDDIYERVDEGIRLYDKVLLICSEASLTSWWVDNEVDSAFAKERRLMRERKEKVLALIPINLDGYLFDEAFRGGKKQLLRSRLAADFAGWERDNEQFERPFERLVQALRSDAAVREPSPDPKL